MNVIDSALRAMLAEHDLTAGLSESDINRLAELARPATFASGAEIFHTGAPADRCILIRDGQVAIEVQTADTRRLIVQTLGAGKVLGWSWLIAPYTWCFDARAQALTRAVSIDGPRLRAALEADHAFGYRILARFSQVFADRLHAVRLQMLDMYGDQPRGS